MKKIEDFKKLIKSGKITKDEAMDLIKWIEYHFKDIVSGTGGVQPADDTPPPDNPPHKPKT